MRKRSSQPLCLSTTRDSVRGAVAALAKRSRQDICDGHRLDALGLSGIVRIELAVLLEERLGVPVTDATVFRARTVGDLVRALVTRRRAPASLPV